KAGRPDRTKPSEKRISPGVDAGLSYGTTPGQLGAMPAGTPPQVEGIVSSPPYCGGNGIVGTGGVVHQGPEKLPPNCGDILKAHGGNHADYGHTEGQLGNEQGDTFWTAARDILRECYHILKPGGVAAWVCKAFVRNKQLVDFPAQWAQLCR